MSIRTAFTVVVPEVGVPYAVLGTGPVEIAREPQMADVRSACQEIASDYVAQAAAQYVMQLVGSQPPAPQKRVREALSKRAKE